MRDLSANKIRIEAALSTAQMESDRNQKRLALDMADHHKKAQERRASLAAKEKAEAEAKLLRVELHAREAAMKEAKATRAELLASRETVARVEAEAAQLRVKMEASETVTPASRKQHDRLVGVNAEMDRQINDLEEKAAARTQLLSKVTVHSRQLRDTVKLYHGIAGECIEWLVQDEGARPDKFAQGMAFSKALRATVAVLSVSTPTTGSSSSSSGSNSTNIDEAAVAALAAKTEAESVRTTTAAAVGMERLCEKMATFEAEARRREIMLREALQREVMFDEARLRSGTASGHVVISSVVDSTEGRSSTNGRRRQAKSERAAESSGQSTSACAYALRASGRRKAHDQSGVGAGTAGRVEEENIGDRPSTNDGGLTAERPETFEQRRRAGDDASAMGVTAEQPPEVSHRNVCARILDSVYGYGGVHHAAAVSGESIMKSRWYECCGGPSLYTVPR